MSCLMLLASLRGLLPSRSLLRVGRLFLGATALHTPVISGQQPADTFGGTALDGISAPVDTARDELGHRRALRQARRGRGLDLRFGRSPRRLPTFVGSRPPRVVRGGV